MIVCKAVWWLLAIHVLEKKDQITPHVKFCVFHLNMRLVWDERCKISTVCLSAVRWVAWDEWCEMSAVRWVLWDEWREMSVVCEESCEMSVVCEESCEMSGARWAVVWGVLWDERCEMNGMMRCKYMKYTCAIECCACHAERSRGPAGDQARSRYFRLCVLRLPRKEEPRPLRRQSAPQLRQGALCTARATQCGWDELWGVSCVWDELCEMSCVRWVVWDELCVRWGLWDELWMRWVVWDELCEMRGVRWVGVRGAAEADAWTRTRAAGCNRRKQEPHSDVGKKKSSHWSRCYQFKLTTSSTTAPAHHPRRSGAPDHPTISESFYWVLPHGFNQGQQLLIIVVCGKWWQRKICKPKKCFLDTLVYTPVQFSRVNWDHDLRHIARVRFKFWICLRSTHKKQVWQMYWKQTWQKPQIRKFRKQIYGSSVLL